MVEIPPELSELFSREIGAGARKIYDRGVAMIDAGRLPNGCAMVSAAVGDAPALHTEALQEAQNYGQNNPRLAAALVGAVRDGLLLAVEAECRRLEGDATAAIKGRHVLDLTMASGVRYTDATQRQMALNRAAVVYLGRLEVLLRDYQLDTTSK